MKPIAIAALIALAAGACSSSSSRPHAEGILGVETEALLQVSMPDSVDTQMLHYHGFDVAFNPAKKVPNYVAWELTSSEVDASEASRAQSVFAPDTRVIGSPTSADYKNSGYDRGHMCPAADMKWSKQAMDDCHLLTNICPQSKALNAGAWNTLEIKCRNWARADSAIIIICGPVLTDHIAQTIGYSRVAVPERFFKVVLRPYADPPSALGFIMPNANVAGGLGSTAVSVDEIERITGFDFFSALPDSIEDRIEANSTLAHWEKRKH